MIAAIVPAAGLSSRMGHNKLLWRFRGRTLIEHAVDTLLACEVQEIVVILGHEADQIRRRLEGKQVNFVPNLNYREGLSTSLRAGLQALSPSSKGVMIYLADQPLLEPAEINLLVRSFKEAERVGKSIVVPFFRHRKGNPVILAASYRQRASEIVGDEGFKNIIKQHPEEVYGVEMENDHVVRDLDTPQDLEGLRTFENSCSTPDQGKGVA